MKEQSSADVINIYNKRAKRYNFSTAVLYNVLGMRVNHHRQKAVDSLNIKEGDTVVEIGCGTGGNFPFIQKRIGKGGRIIGVDLSGAMLEEARHRINYAQWNNVELIQSDADSFTFPSNVNAILSTFAITMSPVYEVIIDNGIKALSTEGKWVIMDFKLPSNWLKKFLGLLVFLVRPYGGTLEMADRHPWEIIQREMSNFSITKFWCGMAYIAAGTKT